MMVVYPLIYLSLLRGVLTLGATDPWDWKRLLMELKWISKSWRNNFVALQSCCFINAGFGEAEIGKLKVFLSIPSPRHPLYGPVRLHLIMSYSGIGLVKKKLDQTGCHCQERRRRGGGRKDVPTPRFWWRWLKIKWVMYAFLNMLVTAN